MAKQWRSKYTGEQIEAILDRMAAGIGDEEYAIIQFKNRYEFPVVGKTGTLYVAIDENLAYIWNETELCYKPLQPVYTVINGGGID